MVDELMDVFPIQTSVRRQFVGEDFRAARDMLLYLIVQGTALPIGDVLNADFAGLAVEQPNDQFLTGTAGAGDLLRLLVGVHIAGETAYKTFVHLDWTARTKLLKAAPLHGFADTMEHEPSGFLMHLEIARQFVAANPILAIGYQPDGNKPLVQTERAILEDRTLLDREHLLGVLGFTLPQTAGSQIAMLFASASRAANAIRPAQRNEYVLAIVRIGEEPDRFNETDRPVPTFVHAYNLAGDGW